VLPAEEPRIDGPGTGSDHCQSGAKGGQNDGDPGIARTRESDPQLGNGYESSAHWGPQADEKKYSCTRCNHLRDRGYELMCFTKVEDPIVY
jgi:hypothetical protein